MASSIPFKDILVGSTVRFVSKNDPSVKYKVKVISTDKKTEKALLEYLEGDNKGKQVNIPADRIYRTQGRQVGSSPAKKVTPPVADKKEVAKSKDKAKAKQEEPEEVMDPESARAELIELQEDMLDIASRMAAIANFLEKIEVKEADSSPEEDEEGEEEAEASPSPEPEKKRRRRSSRPMNNDSDEE